MFIEEALSEPTITFRPLIEDWQSLTESYGEDFFFLAEEEKQGVLARIKAFVKKLYETIKGYVMKAIAWVKGLFSKKTSAEGGAGDPAAAAEVKEEAKAASEAAKKGDVDQANEHIKNAIRRAKEFAKGHPETEKEFDEILSRLGRDPKTAAERLERLVNGHAFNHIMKGGSNSEKIVKVAVSQKTIEQIQSPASEILPSTEKILKSRTSKEIQAALADFKALFPHGKTEVSLSEQIQDAVHLNLGLLSGLVSNGLIKLEREVGQAQDPEEAKLLAEQLQAFSSAIRIWTAACLALSRHFQKNKDGEFVL